MCTEMRRGGGNEGGIGEGGAERGGGGNQRGPSMGEM
jgi:hypothetical protein